MVNKKDKDLEMESFFRQEYRSLYRYVYTIANDAEDAGEVVQEAFLRFYGLHLKGEIRSNDRALLFRLARNLIVDSLRRSQTRETYEQEIQNGKLVLFHERSNQTPEQVLLENERRQLVQQALRQLNRKEQECLALRRSGLSYQEVAAALHLNPQSVGPVIARALRKFRGFYAEILEKKAPSGKARSAGRG
jgi:RNA polymerase sigma factor (sigma-70 family)